MSTNPTVVDPLENSITLQAPKKARKPFLPYFARTDAGNAELFAHLFGDFVRYDHLQSRWLIWRKDRKRWTADNECKVRTFAIEAARARLKSALSLPADGEEENPRQRKEISWALRSESRPSLDAALELAKSMSPISDQGISWDTNHFLLGVANGVVDLKTGKLRDELPADRITKHSPVRFDPDAKCPRFEGFLKTIFPNNPEAMSKYVQKMIGYSLTGAVNEQRIFCNYGEGSNGKTTLFETIRFILGDYSVDLPFSALELSRWGNNSTHELVPLYGARFATSSETNDGVRFNEARLKSLSGGDPITARRMYQNSFTFLPTHKLWLAFNHKPVVADSSYGFWRRIDLIGYNKKFTEKEKDETFVLKLQAEAPGILALAVRGCLLWKNEGLGRPPDVEAATAAYQQESDSLSQFVSDCCIIDASAKTASSVLWQRYLRWTEENEVAGRLSQRTFIERLAKKLNLQSDRVGHEGNRGWSGIGLREGT